MITKEKKDGEIVMKAITIQQPWASLIACGAKKIRDTELGNEVPGADCDSCGGKLCRICICLLLRWKRHCGIKNTSLANVRKIEPIPVKGKQRLWEWDYESPTSQS